MKVFSSNIKNYLYLLYRLTSPLFDIVKFVTGFTGYFWFFRDLFKYKSKDPDARLINVNLFPVLSDKSDYTPFDAQYYFQQLWVFEKVMKINPAQHVDVGSTYQLSGFLSRIVPTVFIDIRPIETELDNLVTKKGNILDIPYPDNSIESLSCLHVIEHVGLGRYGDAIDPEGTMKACKELSRVLKKNGLLYLSLPVGKERICFNAHRVCSPKNVTKYFENLKLLEFSVVDDTGKFIRSCDYREYEHADYSCGLFLFTK